jgi:hypothetical protein
MYSGLVSWRRVPHAPPVAHLVVWDCHVEVVDHIRRHTRENEEEDPNLSSCYYQRNYYLLSSHCRYEKVEDCVWVGQMIDDWGEAILLPLRNSVVVVKTARARDLYLYESMMLALTGSVFLRRLPHGVAGESLPAVILAVLVMTTS